ncbi:MAG: AAA family ATPase [Chitinophagaceae bacterium]
MPFLRSFNVNTERQHPFPFGIPAVKFAKDVLLDSPVTILVGDNGCGKSTLLEAIAYKLSLPLIGGEIKENAGFEAAEILQPFIELSWKHETHRGFFFRAEDFSDFVLGVDREKGKILSELNELKGVANNDIMNQLNESMNWRLRAMKRSYGENMQAYSHGEAYLKILQTRIGDKGIFLLDEPEAALSPLKQLSLIALIMEIIKGKNAQFIIATHSPILMGVPGATLYEIQEDGMQKVAYTETDHYRITKHFLDDPQFYLRHF